MREITEVKEIQGVLLQLLGRFDEICTLHGLTYYLANGTLLGAVKYGGFVPWDDDVDVLMPREDYDKLLSLAKSIADEHCEIYAPATDLGWRMPYAKFTDKRTVWQEGSFDFGREIGVSIDVFPIDKWHPNPWIARLQAIRCDVWKRMLIYTVDPTVYTDKKGIKKGILKAICRRANQIGYDGVFSRIARFCEKTKKYPNKNCGCVVWTSHATAEVLAADCFAHGGMLRFEDGEYPVPKGYEEYLSHLYGDYKKELPPDQQKTNHRAKVWWKYE